jgi:hypothetical protein
MIFSIRASSCSSFCVSAGEALAISIPSSETAVLKHFQERMPYGLFVPDVPWNIHCARLFLQWSSSHYPNSPREAPETPPFSCSGGVLVLANDFPHATGRPKRPFCEAVYSLTRRSRRLCAYFAVTPRLPQSLWNIPARYLTLTAQRIAS